MLPHIDLLQVHRASVEALRSRELYKVLDDTRASGIPALGASVKDVEAARIAIENGVFGWLQIPYSLARREMEPVFAMAGERRIRIIVNRPFAEGRLLDGSSVQEAFRFILEQPFQGAIIPGTQSPLHLRENAHAFRAARDMLAKPR